MNASELRAQVRTLRRENKRLNRLLAQAGVELSDRRRVGNELADILTRIVRKLGCEEAVPACVRWERIKRTGDKS